MKGIVFTRTRTDKVNVLTPSASGQPIDCLFAQHKTDNHLPAMQSQPLTETQRAGKRSSGMMHNLAGQK